MSKSFVIVRDASDPAGARLIQGQQLGESTLKDKWLPAIRAVSGNPDMSADQVHVRGMWLCNSKRDHYYSKFSMQALADIAEMLPDRPVMCAHDYRTLPVGRFFHAERTYRNSGAAKQDDYWVKGLFYIPRDAEGDAIVRRIDMGIYREVSAGWRCLEANCTLCGNPINDRHACGHVPGEVYEEGLCDFQFDGVTAVLEGSLVFAGGQKDTGLFNPGPPAATGAQASREDEPAVTVEEFADMVDLPSRKVGPWKRTFVSQALPDIESRGQRQLRGSIQAVVCDRASFRDLSGPTSGLNAAKRWVRDHEFRSDLFQEHDDSFRFNQFTDGFDEASVRVIPASKNDPGVHFVVAKRKQRSAETEEGVPIDALFAAS